MNCSAHTPLSVTYSINARRTRARGVCSSGLGDDLRPPCTGDAPVRVRRQGLTMQGKYGTRMGRLKYRTKAEANAAARELGLSGSHSHMMDGQRVHMPGTNHEKLNKALRSRGLPTTMVPGKGGGSGSMMGGGMGGDMGKMSMGMADSAAPDPQPGSEMRDIEQGLFGVANEAGLADGVAPSDDDPPPEPAPGTPPAVKPVFDVESLTGDRDDDDEMEIY